MSTLGFEFNNFLSNALVVLIVSSNKKETSTEFIHINIRYVCITLKMENNKIKYILNSRLYTINILIIMYI